MIETKSIERVVRMAVRRLFVVVFVFVQMPVHAQADSCLLYTSDAADE